MVKKGEMYWYKSQKEIYGFIVLENQKGMYGSNDFLIAISDKLDFIGKEPKSQDVLIASLFTLAWFWDDSILPERRIHYITQITLTDSYINYAGIQEDEKGSYSLSNIGNSKMWRHEYRRMVLPGVLMKDVLSVQNIPRTIDDYDVDCNNSHGENKKEYKSKNDEKRFEDHNYRPFLHQKGESVFFSPEETSINIWIDIDEEVTSDDRAMKYVVEIIDHMDTVFNKVKAYLKKILMNEDDENYETVSGFINFHLSYIISNETNYYLCENEPNMSSINMIDYLKIQRLASHKGKDGKQLLIDLDLCFPSDSTNEVLMITLSSEGKIISVQHES